MSRVFFIGDTHFSHKNITKHRPQFSTRKEHEDYIINNYLKNIKKRDTVYFMGDAAFQQEGLDLIKALPGTKRLILGNHDLRDTYALLKTFKSVDAMLSYKGIWLTHAPIHPMELQWRKGNIHGHTHNYNVPDKRYFNTSCENINFTPILFQDILKQMGLNEK